MATFRSTPAAVAAITTAGRTLRAVSFVWGETHLEADILGLCAAADRVKTTTKIDAIAARLYAAVEEAPAYEQECVAGAVQYAYAVVAARGGRHGEAERAGTTAVAHLNYVVNHATRGAARVIGAV